MSFSRGLRAMLGRDRSRSAEPVDLVALGGLRAPMSADHSSVFLRPVNPLFIWSTLIIALLLNFLPWGSLALVPDFVALALVFWNVHQPHRVGIGAAFVFGLLMDVHNGALLGQHALGYSLLSYGAITLHRRVLWYPPRAQPFPVCGLLLLAQVSSMVVRLWVGGRFPGVLYFGESIVGAAIWPLVSWVLLAPQRLPPEQGSARSR
jgi:rod shape-determining protein MreD